MRGLASFLPCTILAMDLQYFVLSPRDFGAAAVTFPILSLTVVGLRFYSKRSRQVKYGIEDWLIVLALVSPSSSLLCFKAYALEGIHDNN